MPDAQATLSVPSLEQAAALAELLMSGHTLSGLLGQSEESQEALYSLGYTFYNQGKYPEAMRLFAYLLTHNHLDRRYYNGFAACLQVQKRYAEALKYYGIASLLDMTDPAAPLHMAECHLSLQDAAQARQSLEFALPQARASERHSALVPRIEAMLAFLAGGPSASAGATPAQH